MIKKIIEKRYVISIFSYNYKNKEELMENFILTSAYS